MKNYLNKCSPLKSNISKSKKIINTILFLILGIILGVFSKWLDNLAIYDSIWWQRLLGILDLRNIFSEMGIWLLIAISISIFSRSPLRASINTLVFFVGMNISYHLYTIYFSGFNPKNYMLIWYTITVFSPILAYICWYAKGNEKISYIISIGILTIMYKYCFAIGLWYFDFIGIIDTTIFMITALILYDNPKKSIYTLIIGLVLSFLMSNYL